MDQRYISHELTHFVGRGLKGDEEAQFKLLCKIVNDGELLASMWMNGPAMPYSNRPGTTSSAISVGDARLPDHSLMDETLITSTMVCFCDIPVADFGLHMAKFSRFGLAFAKEYLVTQHGATPVFYVAKNAQGRPPRKPLGDIMNHMAAELGKVADEMHDQRETYSGLSRTLRWAFGDLYTNVLSFVKPFTCEEGDESSAYSEREWRTCTNVPFQLDDVSRIIIPREFAQRFRNEFPEYHGQLNFADPLPNAA